MSQINLSSQLLVGFSDPFILEGPGVDYTLVETKFFDSWNNIAGIDPAGNFNFANMTFYTADLLDPPSFVQYMETQIAEKFAQALEGTPMALRLWHKEVFSVGTPDHIHIPDFIPFGIGGTDVGLGILGGVELVSAHEWVIQLIYHNVIELAGVWAFMFAILLVIGFIVIWYSINGGSLHLDPHIGELIKAITPAGAAGAFGQVALIGLGLVIAVGVLFPQISTNLGTSLGVGPVSTQIGLGTGGRAPAARPRPTGGRR